MPEQLTVKEALEQGYTHFGYSDEGYQAMLDLVDFRPEEAEGKACLFDKEFTTLNVKAEWLRDELLDRISDKWDEDTNDDTREVEYMLKEIPVSSFEQLASEINEALSAKHYYKLTKIKLVP